MGILDKIKHDISNTGGNRGKFLYFKADEKVRIRFLEDFEDGHEITFHESFEDSVKVPCQSQYGRDCAYCDRPDDYTNLKTRSRYAWSVWDYDSNEVKVLLEPVSRCSPIPPILACYEDKETLLDRDYVLTSHGKGTSKYFTVMPQDPEVFRNKKAKPYTEKQLLELIDQAWPDDANESDDSYEAKPKKKPKAGSDDWDDDESESKYASMKPKALYDLCVERSIDCQPRKSQKYYIGLLEKADAVADDWSDDDYDDGDDWEEE